MCQVSHITNANSYGHGPFPTMHSRMACKVRKFSFFWQGNFRTFRSKNCKFRDPFPFSRGSSQFMTAKNGGGGFRNTLPPLSANVSISLTPFPTFVSQCQYLPNPPSFLRISYVSIFNTTVSLNDQISLKNFNI